jgi:hypothetical protein
VSQPEKHRPGWDQKDARTSAQILNGRVIADRSIYRTSNRSNNTQWRQFLFFFLFFPRKKLGSKKVQVKHPQLRSIHKEDRVLTKTVFYTLVRTSFRSKRNRDTTKISDRITGSNSSIHTTVGIHIFLYRRRPTHPVSSTAANRKV